MAKETFSLGDFKTFLERYSLSEEQFQNANIQWEALEEIARRQHANLVALETAGSTIVQYLRTVPEVHSLKVRAKSPEHLAEKVIRKLIERSDAEITPENYRSHITDLVGVRALHLFKDEWQSIHAFVINSWDLLETPLAYIREGDTKDIQEQFLKAGCEVKAHPHGYRSVHYLLTSQPTRDPITVELQVRTIFEEGWSEIDHRIRYPYKKDDAILSQYLVMFNRLAGSADEMGTFIRTLTDLVTAERAATKAAQKAAMDSEGKLKSAISKLKVSEKEKLDLKSRVDELTKATSLKVSAGGVLSLGDTMSGLEAFRGELGKLDWAKALAGLNTPKLSVTLPQVKCKSCGKSFPASLFLMGPNTCPHCGAAQ